MEEQTFSYQGRYSRQGNFIPHYLEQSQTLFTGISLQPKESFKPSPAVPDPLSPLERKEQSRRRQFDRIIKELKDLELPGSELAITYLTHQFRRNCKESTLASSGTAIKLFLTFLKISGTDQLEDLTRQDIGAFVEQLQDKGLKISSVRNRLVAVYSFIQFLADNDLFVSDVLSKKIKLNLPDPLPRAIDPQDVKALFSVIDHPRNRAMFLLLLRTGMRIGELLDLRPADVNLQEQKVMIYIGEKNYQGRVVYFSDDARETLGEWIKVRDPQRQCLFHSSNRHSLTYATIRVRFNKYLGKAGLGHKGYTMHQLRHTFATDMLNVGMRIESLQPLLGHSTLEMTRRYAKLSDKSRENEYFRAMSIIERGMTDEDRRLDHKLQAVLEEKELFCSHG
jgi:site-specific recombinase XerD